MSMVAAIFYFVNPKEVEAGGCMSETSLFGNFLDTYRALRLTLTRAEKQIELSSLVNA